MKLIELHEKVLIGTMEQPSFKLGDIIDKIVDAVGGTRKQALAFFAGEKPPSNMKNYLELLDDAGYNIDGDFQKNHSWFAHNGISQAQVNVLARHSERDGK